MDILFINGVGKTCLVTKYIKNTLHKDVGPTIAASFFTCKVILDDAKVKLQVSNCLTKNIAKIIKKKLNKKKL
ncbi:ras-like GTP-binding protein RYL2 isoform X2 [Lucilia sericata]|uniref:ras-like GTP-binding protein RYL2 isoform X2 n=1 Tax=Lucilia sericata TaxID=13632 RepID=UPI0018A8079A|nr:ras-like GTP-binding protein RYL2 isoform X2 [Lucilia sericata]